MKHLAISIGIAAGIASAAGAYQDAYVLSTEERRIHVIDTATGLELPASDFRTNGNPRGMTIDDYDTLFVAADNEATIHFAGARDHRIDLHFSQAGLYSEDVTLSRGQDALYVLQTGSAAGQAVLIEVGVSATLVNCFDDLTRDCYLGSQDSTLHTLPLYDPRFAATSVTTGEVFTVGEAGDVAVFDPATGTASQLALGVNPAPANPGGMAAGPDGRIAITGNGTGGSTLTLITPGATPRIETIALPFAEVGGVRFDPRRRSNGFGVVVGDVSGHAIAEVRGGQVGTPRSIGGNGANPVDLVVNHRGVVVTANENARATTVFSSSLVDAPLVHGLVAVELGPPKLDPHVFADPWELRWIYASLNTWIGPRAFTVENIGDGLLHITGLSIVGFDRGNFAITSETCTGRMLDVDDTCTVEIDFRAGAYTSLPSYRYVFATYGARLRIVSTDDPLELPLVGEHVSSTLERLVVESDVRTRFTFGD